MTFLSPLIIKSIFLTAGASALAYCLAKIGEFNCTIKTLSSNISNNINSLHVNENLTRNISDDLDIMRRLVKENSCRIDKLDENLTAIKTDQAIHKNHIDKLKELSAKQDVKPVENKKKNS